MCNIFLYNFLSSTSFIYHKNIHFYVYFSCESCESFGMQEKSRDSLIKNTIWKKGNLKALKHRDRKLKKLFAHYWIFHSDSFFPQSWNRKVLHLFSSHWSLSYIWITNVLFQHITAEKWKTKNLDVSRTEVKFFTSLSWIN